MRRLFLHHKNKSHKTLYARHREAPAASESLREQAPAEIKGELAELLKDVKGKAEKTPKLSEVPLSGNATLDNTFERYTKYPPTTLKEVAALGEILKSLEGLQDHPRYRKLEAIKNAALDKILEGQKERSDIVVARVEEEGIINRLSKLPEKQKAPIKADGTVELPPKKQASLLAEMASFLGSKESEKALDDITEEAETRGLISPINNPKNYYA